MSTHDYNLANATGAAFRADLNLALAAIASNNSNATDPATTFAFQWYVDTADNKIKIRNAANDGYIEVGDVTAANLGLAKLASPSFTGNVGIGTTAPNNLLEVVGGSSGSTTTLMQLRSNASGTNTASTLQFLNSTAADSAFGVASITASRTDIGASGSTDLIFKTSLGGVVSDKLVINSSGNVGIGTSSPVTPLHIHKATGGLAGVQISNSTHGSTLTDGLFVGIDNSHSYLHNYENTPLLFGTNNTERLRIDSSGTVGINNDIVFGNQSASGTGGTGRLVATGGEVFIQGGLAKTSGSSAPIVFTAFGGVNERMRIDSSGNVGIGTSAPLIPIQLNSFGGLDGNDNQLIISNNTYYSSGDKAAKAGFSTRIDLTNQDGSIRFINTAASSSANAAITLEERMRINSSGNLGIGTTSPNFTSFGSSTGGLEISDVNTNNALLVQSGSNEFFFANNSSANYIWTPGAIPFIIGTNATERMRIDSSGRVGIGNTSPGSQFFNDVVVGNGSNDRGITIHSGSGSRGILAFSDATSGDGRYDGYIAYDHSDRAMKFHTNTGSERMRIDSSGNLGIGTTSPVFKFHANETSGPSIAGLFQTNQTESFISFAASGTTATSTVRLGASGDNLIAFVNGGERLRIDSSGNLLIHQSASTTPGTGNISVGASFESLGSTVGSALHLSRSNGPSLFLNANANTQVARFHASGTDVGSISVTGSATAFNTSSDYRLKENVVSLDDGITRLKQLSPKRFNFIASPEKTVDGFLAHEAQVVVPQAVSGTHNEVDDKGNAVMQQIDQSKLVPLLTAALQEAIAKIETLEAKVAALEAG